MTRFIDRLSTTLDDPAKVQALKGSLAKWHEVAANEQWRADPAPKFLRDQAVLWRDLLVGELSPTALVQQKTRVLRIGTIRPLVRTLLPQVALIALSAIVFSIGAWLISSHHVSGPLGQIVAGLGAVGVTGSALSTKAKSYTNQLGSKVRDAVETDLVVEAATVVPKPPREARRQQPGRLAPPGSSSEPITIESLNLKVDTLPFARYDELSASQVIERLSDAAPELRRAVRTYEASHRNRRAILAGIDQLGEQEVASNVA